MSVFKSDTITFITGIAGSITSVTVPFLDEYVMPVIQYGSGLLGFVLVVLSVYIKINKLRNDKKAANNTN